MRIAVERVTTILQEEGQHTIKLLQKEGVRFRLGILKIPLTRYEGSFFGPGPSRDEQDARLMKVAEKRAEMFDTIFRREVPLMRVTTKRRRRIKDPIITAQNS